MTRDTDIQARTDDDGEGLTGEAVLHYRQLPAEEKKKSRAVTGPLPQEGPAYTGAAGFGVAAVSFDDNQLHADLSGARDGLDDPWGAEVDEYDVPAPVTRSEEQDRDRRRARGGGLAVRGSGTRGGAKGGGPAMAPGPVMGTPGAGVGGVGGAGAVGVPGVPATAPPVGSQLGMVHSGATGSMPAGMLHNAQSASRAATSSVFSPPAGSGGLQAATAGEGVYDPGVLRESLRVNGFSIDGAGAGGGFELVDTDGDGIPDTPRNQVQTSGALPGSPGAPRPTTGGGAGAGGGLPGLAPGGGTSGTSGQQPSGTTTVLPPGATTPGSGSAGGSGAGLGSGSAGTGSVGNGSVGNGSVGTGGPAAASGGSGSSGTPGIDFSQSTGVYAGSGGGGYSVTTDDLRRDSRQWAGVADETAPLTETIIASPNAATMFGHMLAPVRHYRAAVDTSRDFVVQSGEESMAISETTLGSANDFDAQELAAVAESGRIL